MKTVKDISDILHVNTETVRIWLRNNEISGSKRDGCWVISDAEFNEFLIKHPKYEEIYYLETYNHKPPARNEKHAVKVAKNTENRRGLKKLQEMLEKSLSES